MILADNTILIDWLSFTTKKLKQDDIINNLGMNPEKFTLTKGAHGYKNRLYYDGISVHYDGNGGSTWCEMSGQGCRTFETYGTGDYEAIFDNIIENHENRQYNITRLDIAYDDKNGILDINKLSKDILDGNYVSKMNSWEVIQSNKGVCINIGSPQSDVKIRIYDKARERHCEEGTHWIRVEIQLRDDRAYQFIELMRYHEHIGEVFKGVLHNYLRVVEPNEDDTNKARWETADYWKRLIEDVEKMSVYKKVGSDYNLDRVQSYIINQCGGALETLLRAYGVNYVIYMLKDRKTNMNPKYKEIIKENDKYDLSELAKLYGVVNEKELIEMMKYKDDIIEYINKYRYKSDDEFYNMLRSHSAINHQN